MNRPIARDRASMAGQVHRQRHREDHGRDGQQEQQQAGQQAGHVHALPGIRRPAGPVAI